MAHYAEVIDGTVVRVVVVSNAVTTIDGVEDEQRGVDFLDGLLPTGGAWVQTSYNSTFRYNYAGPGHTWDASAGAFYAPQPFPSWSLDENYVWQAPVAYPGGTIYALPLHYWDDDANQWVEIQAP